MKTRKRILEVIRQGSVGGGETHVLELSRRLDSAKFEPVVLAFTDGQLIDRLNDLQIENYVIPTERPFDVKVWKQVKQLMVDKSIDLVHAHGTRAMTNVLRVSRKLNLPLIYTVHGWSFHNDLPASRKKLRRLTEQYLCLKANITVNVSAANQRQGRSLHKKFASELIYNGVDLDRYKPDAVSGDLRSELGIDKDATLIGFISRLTKQKDPLTLLRGFRTAVEQEPDMKLLMVGEGELQEAVSQFVKDNNLHEKVIMLPFRSDVPDILRAIDIYCLPSLWEGLPIGVLEAMAMQKAVVASDVDGTSEIIDDGINGILIKPQDESAVMKKLILLHKDKDYRQKLATSARKVIEEKYNVEKMVADVERLYLSLLKQ